MDSHINEYYRQSSDGSPRGNFHKVIALHNAPDIDWATIHQLVPTITRGWYELAHLTSIDRVEFLRDYWLDKMPYHSKLPAFLMKFFDAIDDIGVFIVEKKFQDPYEVHLVYSLKDNKGFFKGHIPASDQALDELKRAFPNIIFPADYLAFLQIHDGFSKISDCTGITSSSKMRELFEAFQSMLEQQDRVTTSKGTSVTPNTLIPFYESFGMPFYQCFWAEWYPENEMGNVYYSGVTQKISDIDVEDPSVDTMAFSTFTDWLIFYLETIE